MNYQEVLDDFRKKIARLEELTYTDGHTGTYDYELLHDYYPALVNKLITTLETFFNREKELILQIENVKKQIPPPSDREGLQSYQGYGRYGSWGERDEEINDDDENCWVEYPSDVE